INLDWGFLLSVSCIVDTDFYSRILMSTTIPLLVLAALGGTYSISRRRNRRSVLVIIWLTLLVYSSVSSTIFQTFACDDLGEGGDGYLRADYSILCGTVRHHQFQVYAAVMMLIYPLGIPLLYVALMFQHRVALSNETCSRKTREELKPLAVLWGPYRPSRYYYELVECGRRITLTGIVVFVLPDSAAQIAVTLWLSLMFWAVSEVLRPYHGFVERWLYRIGHLVVFASMYVALLLDVDVSDEDERS
ncbi:unnamed protein product, partial [Laminaria digitata]